MAKFAVFSLLIRELSTESGSHQTCLIRHPLRAFRVRPIKRLEVEVQDWTDIMHGLSIAACYGAAKD